MFSSFKLDMFCRSYRKNKGVLALGVVFSLICLFVLVFLKFLFSGLTFIFRKLNANYVSGFSRKCGHKNQEMLVPSDLKIIFNHFLFLLVLYVFGLCGVVGRNIWLLLSECFGEILDCNPFGSKSGKLTVACYK